MASTSSPMSPAIRMEQSRSLESTNTNIDIELPTTPTPKEKLEYVEPIVIILPPPVTPSSYLSSPPSLPERTGTGFEERLDYAKPVVTNLPSPSISSKYFSPESQDERMETDFDLPQSSKPKTPPRNLSRRNINVDTTHLSKKMKMWFDHQISPRCTASSSLMEQTPAVIDLTSSENGSIHSMSSMMVSPMRSNYTEATLSPSTLLHLDQTSPILTNRYSVDIPRGIDKSSSFEHQFGLPKIILTRKTSSIPTEIIDLTNDDSDDEITIDTMSRMRTSERETSEETTGETSSIGYITSTTTIWDVNAKELSYSISSASDTTGDEDYSVVFERRCQKEIERKQQLKWEEEHRKIQERQLRKDNFREFSIKGITWSTFSPEKISFSVKPRNLYPDYFSSKKKYSFSMNYGGKYWSIKTFRVPEYELILKLYLKTCITDENIKQFLEYVVDVLFRYIELEKEFRERRAAEYYAGEDISLNESEIELLLNEDEKKQFRERCEKLWRGMMSPDLF